LAFSQGQIFLPQRHEVTQRKVALKASSCVLIKIRQLNRKYEPPGRQKRQEKEFKILSLRSLRPGGEKAFKFTSLRLLLW
jgi:hypothetical protein